MPLMPALLRLVLFTVMCGVLLSACGENGDKKPARQWAEKVELPAADNFFKVSESLYRSGQPDHLAMVAYQEFGIKTVINLRAYHSDREAAWGTRLTLVEIPVLSWEEGNEDIVIRVLQAVRDAEKPVLVHGGTGAERTGLMAAMYRVVEERWTRKEAIDEMRDGGFGFDPAWTGIVKFIENADIEEIRISLR